MNAPTVMRHRDSRARAEQAYVMHLDGYSWQDIADALSFRNRSSAQSAANRHLVATTPDPNHIARRKWIDRKTRQRARVSRQLACAEADNDHQAVAQLSAAIDRIDDQLAKVHAYYAPAQQNVNVSVSATPVESWRQQMLDQAAVAQRPNLPAAPVLDAEVVE
jgi:hypothetical protein